MTSRPIILLVILVTLLAGCNGDALLDEGGLQSSNPPATDTDRYPTGIDRTGVNASAVVESHQRALDGRSVTAVAEWHMGEETTETIRSIVLVSADRESYLHQRSFKQRNTTSYLFDGFVYKRTENPVEDASYHLVQDKRSDRFLVGAEYVNDTLSSANFTPLETTQAETDIVTLRATTEDFQNERENVIAYNATVQVDSNGIVRAVEVNMTENRSGARIQTSHEIRITDIGTTDVPEPSWFDEARSALPEPIEPPEVPSEEVLESTEAYDSGSIVSHELGTAASVVGSPDLIETASLSEWGHAFAQEPLPYAVSTPVEIRAKAPVEVAAIKLRYNESAIPDGDESGLAVYRFNHTIQSFVPLESSVDPANDTVTAQGRDVLDEYEYGDGTYLSAFAVFHVASWEQIWETDVSKEEEESIAENVTLENGVEPPADVSGAERARVSDYVYFDPGSSPGEETLEIEYDESALPDEKETRLAVYRYDETENTYVLLNSAVYPEDDVVTTEPTEPGTYVVLHIDTWESEKDK